MDASGDRWTGIDDDRHGQDLNRILEDGGVAHEVARLAFTSEEAHHGEVIVADGDIGVAGAAYRQKQSKDARRREAILGLKMVGRR